MCQKLIIHTNLFNMPFLYTIMATDTLSYCISSLIGQPSEVFPRGPFLLLSASFATTFRLRTYTPSGKESGKPVAESIPILKHISNHSSTTHHLLK